MIDRNIELITEDILHHAYLIRVVDAELTKLVYKYGTTVHLKISRPIVPGTEQQNRAAHALLTAYYLTGMHSAPEGSTPEFFKIWMKMKYGPCYAMDIDGNNIRVPKLWADYSKEERATFITGIISEIEQVGAYAADTKCREIIDGMREMQNDHLTRPSGAR